RRAILLGKRGCWVLLLAATLILPPPALAQSAGSAGSSAITEWKGSCPGSKRTWWDDMCMAWRKKMGAQGWVQWWRNYATVQARRYTDPLKAAWGDDNSGEGLDSNDAGLICTHGGYDSDRWLGTMYDRSPDNQCGLN